MDLIRVELPGRISSTSDLLSDQQQIPGSGSVASLAETLPGPSLALEFRGRCVVSFRSKDVPSVVRRECLINCVSVWWLFPTEFLIIP